jgi:uncharacterized RDD family membrane protein YckC
MNCEKCQSSEIDDNGKCKVCGFQVYPLMEPDGALLKSEPLPAGLIEMHSPATGRAENGELPAWRKELSRRLQEIRQKRERAAPGEFHRPEDAELTPPAGIELSAAAGAKPAASDAPPEPTIPEAPAEVSKADSKPIPKRSTKGDLRPKPRVSRDPQDSLPLFQPVQRESDIPPPSHDLSRKTESASPKISTLEVTRLIDNILSRQSVQPESHSLPSHPPAGTAAMQQSKLILVSRTLAGMVDWIIIVLCAGATILAADSASGIDFVDKFTLAMFAVLLLAIFWVYSLFFLSTANQTIGMMFTDLRVADRTERRPSIKQVLLRCLGYLLSVSLFGVGLAWAVFDRESRCLHDRLSGTQVRRIGW